MVEVIDVELNKLHLFISNLSEKLHLMLSSRKDPFKYVGV